MRVASFTADKKRNRRLSTAEYREMGEAVRRAATNPDHAMMADIVRQIALTGCWRSEIIGLR